MKQYKIDRRQRFRLSPAGEFVAMLVCFLLITCTVKSCEADEWTAEQEALFQESIDKECAETWFVCIEEWEKQKKLADEIPE